MFKKTSEKARELFFLESGIHMVGNREIMLENCRRIEECSDVFISVVGAGLLINIWGSDLRASDFRTGGLVIRGKIAQIEFEERRRRSEKTASWQNKNKR